MRTWPPISDDLLCFIAANTDAQALAANLAPIKLQLGLTLTKGLGAGANPEMGRKAALEDVEKIREALKDADMVFITAGLGCGTGTGGAPVIAEVAREVGALTVAIVTKPFNFEGKKRLKQAEDGLANLKMTDDALLTIPNQRLLTISGKSMTLLEAFKKADEILFHAAKGISDIIVGQGIINLDFADGAINPFRLWTGAFIPNWLLSRPELTPNEKLLYARLCQYAGRNGYAYPSVSRLAADLAVSERTIFASIRKLREAGLVFVTDRRAEGRSSLYYFLDHDWMHDGPLPSNPATQAKTTAGLAPRRFRSSPRAPMVALPLRNPAST